MYWPRRFPVGTGLEIVLVDGGRRPESPGRTRIGERDGVHFASDNFPPSEWLFKPQENHFRKNELKENG